MPDAVKMVAVERVREISQELDDHPGFAASPDYYGGLGCLEDRIVAWLEELDA